MVQHVTFIDYVKESKFYICNIKESKEKKNNRFVR